MRLLSFFGGMQRLSLWPDQVEAQSPHLRSKKCLECFMSKDFTELILVAPIGLNETPGTHNPKGFEFQLLYPSLQGREIKRISCFR